MGNIGMVSGQGGGPARATGRLALLIRRVGNWLYQAEEARARQYGWQITTHRGGLARTYRDPRFDRFSRCPGCGGAGTCVQGTPPTRTSEMFHSPCGSD